VITTALLAIAHPPPRPRGDVVVLDAELDNLGCLPLDNVSGLCERCRDPTQRWHRDYGARYIDSSYIFLGSSRCSLQFICPVLQPSHELCCVGTAHSAPPAALAAMISAMRTSPADWIRGFILQNTDPPGRSCAMRFAIATVASGNGPLQGLGHIRATSA
jgi:hypothetical protein